MIVKSIGIAAAVVAVETVAVVTTAYVTNKLTEKGLEDSLLSKKEKHKVRLGAHLITGVVALTIGTIGLALATKPILVTEFVDEDGFKWGKF